MTTVAPDVSFFLDAQRAVGLADEGLLYTSNDGGRHWTVTTAQLDGVRFRSIDAATGARNGPSLSQVAFADASAGWAWGIDADSGNPVLIRTEDGGQTWRRQTTGMLPTQPGLMVLDRQRALLGNIGDRVLYTGDGGAHWTAGAAFPATYRYDAKFFAALSGSRRHGVALPYVPNAVVAIQDDRQVIRSTDWGGRFDTVFETDVSLRSIGFADARNGWLVGMAPISERPRLEAPRLWRTMNGGASWAGVAARGLSESVAFSFPTVRFFPGGIGWLDLSPFVNIMFDPDGIAASYRPRVFRTVDGGLNWQELAFPASAGTNLRGVLALGPNLALT